jgi:hypothetical protein
MTMMTSPTLQELIGIIAEMLTTIEGVPGNDKC